MLKLFNTKKEEGILDLLKEVKQSLVDIDLVYTEPQEVNWEAIANQVSTEAYTQLGKELYVRALKSPKDIKYDKEKQHAKDIKSADFKNNMVLFAVFTSKSNFPSHYHHSTESIKCLEGSFIGNNNEVYMKGDTQVVPANKVHIFKGVTDGACLVTIEK